MGDTAVTSKVIVPCLKASVKAISMKNTDLHQGLVNCGLWASTVFIVLLEHSCVHLVSKKKKKKKKKNGVTLKRSRSRHVRGTALHVLCLKSLRF